jgi:hypothetical protein
MSAADLGLVLLVLAAVAAVVAMVVATAALLRATRALRRALVDLEADVAVARQAALAADEGARRAEDTVAQVSELAVELEGGWRLLRRLVLRPVIWVVALFRGVGRVVGGRRSAPRREVAAARRRRRGSGS